ncbi:MAG: hypothetical protein AYK19_13135 [Theionarchaea archaeon DG-70-1]|nr:MAG: hypothetical protein AYK19_13135 [Theionarchaea archaeon DG-70-1]
MKRINKIVTFLYRIYIAPLLGLGFIFVILETVGRKTGKRRFTPVEYHRLYENKVTVVSSRGRKADWVKNIKAAKDIVHLHVGFKKYRAKALFIDDVNTKRELLKSYCVKYPYASRTLLGINVKKDSRILESEAFKSLVDTLEFVVFEPIRENEEKKGNYL